MEAKGETPSAECPPVECRQSDGATGALYRKDRVPQCGPNSGHVVTGRWGLASGQWRQSAESVQALVFDRTLALKVTGRWQDVSGQADVW